MKKNNVNIYSQLTFWVFKNTPKKAFIFPSNFFLFNINNQAKKLSA